MSLSRISARFPRIVLAQLRNSSVISTRHSRASNQFHSIGEPHSKVVADQMSLFHHSSLNASAFQRFGFSSVPSPEKENSPSANGGSTVESDGATAKASGDTEASEQREVPISGDSEEEEELTTDDLVKLVTEKEELLKLKHKEIEKMQDKVLRAYADMENVMDRARREAENSKKFAIQNFAKSLLDVADNLGRASSVVKDGFSKIDTSKDTSGAVPLLKTLLEGVEMTEKQLIEVVGGQVSPFHHSLPNASAFQRFGFSSVPSPKNAAKENSPAAKGPSTVENNGAKPNASGDAEAPERREAPICEDLSKELAMEDRVKLVTEKVQLLKGKVEKIEKMQHKVVRTCKVMEKVAEKDRRDINYAIKKANLAIIITNLAILLVTISSR